LGWLIASVSSKPRPTSASWCSQRRRPARRRPDDRSDQARHRWPADSI